MSEKKTSRQPTQGKVSVLHRSNPWHAVSVITGRWCCEAVRGQIGTRYLSRDAPRLPLAQCSKAEACACSYKHHVDRRGQPRRKDEALGMRRNVPVPNDRRTARGRREDD